MKKSLLVLMVAVVAFVTFNACSDDSGVGGSGTSTSLNTESKKSSEYEVGKGSCGGGHLAKEPNGVMNPLIS